MSEPRIRAASTVSAVLPVNAAPAWLNINPFDQIEEPAIQFEQIAPVLNVAERHFDFDPSQIVAAPDPFNN